MTGRSKERQELADMPLPLEARLAVVPCRGGEPLLRRLFEPLGYEITAKGHPLDTNFQSGVRVGILRLRSMARLD